MKRVWGKTAVVAILAWTAFGAGIGAVAQTGEFTVAVRDGLVTVAADAASSNAILRDLAGKAGFDVAVTAADDRRVTLDLEDASLEAAVQRLSDNYSIVFARTEDGGYRVVKVTSGGAGAGAPEPASGMTAAQVVDEIRRKNRDVKSFKAEMVMSMGMMGSSMEMKGSLLKGEGDEFRMEMDLPFMEGARQVMVSDGEQMLIWMPHMNMLQRIDQKRMEEELGPEIAGSMQRGSMGSQMTGIDDMQPDSLRYLGTEVTDGRRAYVLEGKTKIPEGMPAMPFMPRTQKVWVSAETGFLERAVFYNETGAEMMSQRFSNVVTNPTWEGDPFRLDIPAGVQPIDMTDTTIAMMRQMTGSAGSAREGEAPSAQE